MNNLNEALKVKIKYISIYEINEEKLIRIKVLRLLYAKIIFIFGLINKIKLFEDEKL